jgi:hypothetical protein
LHFLIIRKAASCSSNSELSCKKHTYAISDYYDLNCNAVLELCFEQEEVIVVKLSKLTDASERTRENSFDMEH